jgi:hypothetical protein
MKPLPCPFCGHTGTAKPDRDGDGWIVECPNPDHATGPEGCSVQTRTLPFTSEAAAIRAWNTRARKDKSAGPAKTLAQLKAELATVQKQIEMFS